MSAPHGIPARPRDPGEARETRGPRRRIVPHFFRRCIVKFGTLKIAFGSLLATSLATSVGATTATFTEVAREFSNGVGFLKAEVPVALSDDGRVVFAAESI